jgi:hypothetical protein
VSVAVCRPLPRPPRSNSTDSVMPSPPERLRQQEHLSRSSGASARERDDPRAVVEGLAVAAKSRDARERRWFRLGWALEEIRLAHGLRRVTGPRAFRRPVRDWQACCGVQDLGRLASSATRLLSRLLAAWLKTGTGDIRMFAPGSGRTGYPLAVGADDR